VKVEPALAAIARHTDRAHRDQESEAEDDQHGRGAYEAIESYT